MRIQSKSMWGGMRDSLPPRAPCPSRPPPLAWTSCSTQQRHVLPWALARGRQPSLPYGEDMDQQGRHSPASVAQHAPSDAHVPAAPAAVSRRRFTAQLGVHTAALGLVGFLAVAFDVFDPSSSHILSAADVFGHSLAQSMDPTARKWFWGLGVSDLAITTGMLGWTALTLQAALNPKDEASKPVAVLTLSWLFYALTAGMMDGGPWLVSWLKDLFHRARPSPVHSSMSFPSGHTTAAVFLAATLLFVLIPVVLHKERETAGADPARPHVEFLKQLESSWPLLLAAWGTTAVGRVCGDAHWVSDTLAGGCLSLALASVLAQISEMVVNYDHEGGMGTGASVGEVRLQEVQPQQQQQQQQQQGSRGNGAH